MHERRAGYAVEPFWRAESSSSSSVCTLGPGKFSSIMWGASVGAANRRRKNFNPPTWRGWHWRGRPRRLWRGFMFFVVVVVLVVASLGLAFVLESRSPRPGFTRKAGGRPALDRRLCRGRQRVQRTYTRDGSPRACPGPAWRTAWDSSRLRA